MPVRIPFRCYPVGVRCVPWLVLSCLLALGLSGCGDEPADGVEATDDQTTAASDAREPRCEDVWVAGESLPGRYTGCSDGSTWVGADSQRCDSGQVIVTYIDRYYAAKGFVVNDVGGPLSDSKQYQRALRSCG